MTHILPIPYTRWFATAGSPELASIERGIAAMVWKDLDWLESVLGEDSGSTEQAKAEVKGKEEGKKEGRYIVGYTLTAADTMMLFPIQLVFRRGYCGGRTIGEWRNVEAWVERCEAREGWRRTVEKTGFVVE